MAFLTDCLPGGPQAQAAWMAVLANEPFGVPRSELRKLTPAAVLALYLACERNDDGRPEWPLEKRELGDAVVNYVDSLPLEPEQRRAILARYEKGE